MMNTEVQEYEARRAALAAIEGTLTENERAALMAAAIRRWPPFEHEGASPAEVLHYTTRFDEFTGQTEPFIERFAGQLPQDVRLSAALHALVLLDRELTPGRVIALLQRAGMTRAPLYPDVEVGLRLHERDLGGGPCTSDANHQVLMQRAEQGLRAAGVPEREITAFRNSVRPVGYLDGQRNVADIAFWVTLADRYVTPPFKGYDPFPDLSVVLTWASSEPGDPDCHALDNLRSHLDLSSAETAEAGLRALLGKVL